MPVWAIVLLVIIAILVVALVALIIFGNRLRKKQEANQAQIDAAKQVMSMLIIDKKKMKLDEPIKTLGNHIITVKLHKDVTAKLTVSVGESK